MAPRLRFLLPLFSLVLLSCGRQGASDQAVVALSGDVENFNPVVTGSQVSSEVESQIFPQMFNVRFNLNTGQLEYAPGLVRRWEFTNDGRDVVLHLRNDVKWSTGVAVTARDVKFSYSLYGDPDVASPRGNYVEHMIYTNGRFDPDKSMTVMDDSTIVFHFTHAYPLQLFHLDLSPIPEYIFRDADRMSLRSHPANSKPIGAGPFKLDSWKRQQEIVLSSNLNCTLPAPARLERVVMRVIDEPTTRLTEFKKGTVDMMWPIYPEDVKELQMQHPEIRLQTLPPRVYEYVGWANIDFQEFRRTNGKVIRPHPLFGDTRVRRALTYAINRKGIMDAKLRENGELAVSDFSPLFRWAQNTELRPYPYDPERARQLLRDAGWEDTNGDGILDKGGVPFEFTLIYNTGNARRAYAATVIQENLKQIGIRVTLNTLEPVVYYEQISQKKYDAFIGGYSVGLAIDPSDRWGDIRSPYNNAGFQNSRVLELIKLGMNAGDEQDAAPHWKEIQAILHQEQPFTFMYWIKDIVGINRRLKNTNVNTLGVLDGMGMWKIGDPNSYATF